MQTQLAKRTQRQVWYGGFARLAVTFLVTAFFVEPSAQTSAQASAQISAELSPWQTVERFDSLLMVGTPAALLAAESLTIGPARRLFPLFAETHGKLAPFLDTAQSRDTLLGERRSGRWSVLKIRADVVFALPFLGMEEITSVQAVHLFEDSTGWKIAELEELSETDSIPSPRTGMPAGASSPLAPVLTAASGSLLPLSRLAPAKEDMKRVTRLRLRVSLRDGDSLCLPVDMSGQRVVASGIQDDDGDDGRVWVELETRVPVVSDSLYLAPWDEDLEAYRATTPELDLTDKALRTRAAKLKQGSPHDLETTRRIWRFVSTSFDYKLGVTLFATSREALRDMKGDCSEAAVLTAALLRAAGIPSRVVLGYATLESGVWIGHAWAEAHLGGAWVGVDAALKEFPAGASRIGLHALSGQREMKTDATNLMLNTLGNLDIQILEAWAGEDTVPLIEHPDAAAEAQRFWNQVLEGMGR